MTHTRRPFCLLAVLAPLCLLGGSPADELTRLAALKADGTIDDAEFQRLKAKVLA